MSGRAFVLLTACVALLPVGVSAQAPVIVAQAPIIVAPAPSPGIRVGGATEPAAQPRGLGRFEGTVVTEWNPDGVTMTLTQPFAYVDPFGVRWEAPKGSKINGASIPPISQPFVGNPYEGLYRPASVIHDVACVEQKQPWQDVHRTFYFAMLAGGVPTGKAKVMYAAVYHFGPRWPKPDVLAWCDQCEKPTPEPPAPKTLTEQQFELLEQLITAGETRGQSYGFGIPKSGAEPGPMTLEQIERYNGR